MTKTAISKSKILYLQPNQVKEYWNARQDYGDLEELGESIKQRGIIVPIKVWEDENNTGIYYLTEGHRRHAATKKIMQELDYQIYIPAIIESKDYGQADRVIDQLTVNNSKHLTPIEQGRAIDRAIRYGWSLKEIANQIGKTYATIFYYYKLVKSVPTLQNAVSNNEISYSAALDIIKKHKNHDNQQEALNNLKQKTETSTNLSDKKQEKIRKKDTENKKTKKGRLEKIYNNLQDKTSKNHLIKEKMNILYKLVQYDNGELNFKDLQEYMMDDTIDE